MLQYALSLFGKGFKSSKCKTMAKLVTARIKLLRNKREAVVRQMRRDIALLLQSGQDATARIRVEHVMREQNIMAANEIIELFCELVVARLSIISKQRVCPADLKEGISSLIFAAPRCSDIPELLQIRTIFEKKYGKDFINAATELYPDCGVNRTLIEKLSVRTPTGEVKLKLMKEIAKEYQIAWDPSETEKELLKPPEDLIEGERSFVSAANIPVKPLQSQCGEPDKSSYRLSSDRCQTMYFEDTVSAAKVAAESAEKAIAAAQAAAYLANRDAKQISHTSSFGCGADGLSNSLSSTKYANGNSSNFSLSNNPSEASQDKMHHREIPWETYETRTYNRSYTDLPMLKDPPVDSLDSGKSDQIHSSDRSHVSENVEDKRIYRRHTYHSSAAHSDIKFDESDGTNSDCDEEIEMEASPGASLHPPARPPPPVRSHTCNPDDKSEMDKSSSYRRHSLPRVHPKLPDYEDIAARFEALKVRK